MLTKKKSFPTTAPLVNIKRNISEHFGVWERHQKMFALIAANPQINAPDLVQLASQTGIKLSLSTAYRLLTRYWRNPADASTKARKSLPTIVSILQSLPEGTHRSAAELKSLLEENGQTIHIATIYRELKCLISAGLIVTINQRRTTYYRWHSDAASSGHMVCCRCGQKTDLSTESVEPLAQPVSNRLGYSYSGYELILQGQCGKCLRGETPLSAPESTSYPEA